MTDNAGWFILTEISVIAGGILLAMIMMHLQAYHIMNVKHAPTRSLQALLLMRTRIRDEDRVRDRVNNAVVPQLGGEIMENEVRYCMLY